MKLSSRKALNTFIIFSFLLLIFQSPLARCKLPFFITTLVNSYDEIVAFLCAVFLFFHVVKVGLPKQYIKEFGLFLIFIVVGFISTVLNGLQPFNAVIEDVVNCSKFVLTYLGLSFIYKSYDSKKILMTIQKISTCLVYLLFGLTVLDIVFPHLLFTNTSFRYGVHAVHLFYYHPAVLAQVMVLLISVLSFEPQKVKNIVALKIMCLMILAATLRSKAFGFICFYLFLWGYEKLNHKKTRIVLAFLMIAAVGFVSTGNISRYYGNGNSARATLTADSLNIANENIPIGLGFGMFASASAAKYYSPVYKKLGYSIRYGMGYVNTNYLTDSFWPVLLGQFGYLGTLLYIGIIITVTLRCIRIAQKDKNAAIAELSLIGYLLISSTAATAFFNPISIPTAFLIVLGLKTYDVKGKV